MNIICIKLQFSLPLTRTEGELNSHATTHTDQTRGQGWMLRRGGEEEGVGERANRIH